MSGWLGYRTHAKKLVVLPEEAETVQYIFRRYLELGSAGLLLRDLRDRGIRTKRREQTAGRLVGGVWFGKGALTYLLKNRAHIGQIAHRGEFHTAEHEAIVEREIFEAVQARLQANTHARKLKLEASPYLLTGLLFDTVGNRMSPSHTLKKGVRYQYYVSQGVLQNRDVGEVARVSAPDLEAVIAIFLQQQAHTSPTDLGECLRRLISKVTVRKASIEVEMAEVGKIASIPWQKKVTRAKKEIAYGPSKPIGDQAKARQVVLAAIGKSRAWLKEMIDGGNVADIAERDGRSERQIRILINLAFLPPDQVKSIVDGSEPVSTITDIARKVPLLWPQLSSDPAPQAVGVTQ